MTHQPSETPVAALLAHAAHPPGTRYVRANLAGRQDSLGACDRVVLVRGPDAGATGIIAPPDYPAQPGSASLVVLLDGGRAVVVGRDWCAGVV